LGHLRDNGNLLSPKRDVSEEMPDPAKCTFMKGEAGKKKKRSQFRKLFPEFEAKIDECSKTTAQTWQNDNLSRGSTKEVGPASYCTPGVGGVDFSWLRGGAKGKLCMRWEKVGWWAKGEIGLKKSSSEPEKGGEKGNKSMKLEGSAAGMREKRREKTVLRHEGKNTHFAVKKTHLQPARNGMEHLYTSTASEKKRGMCLLQVGKK